jgi:hypothetical protein
MFSRVRVTASCFALGVPVAANAEEPATLSRVISLCDGVSAVEGRGA